MNTLYRSAARLRRVLLAGATSLALAAVPTGHALELVLSTELMSLAPPARIANFDGQAVSPEVRIIANWVAKSGDHQEFDFLIVDKLNAKVFVFDGQARLRASSAVLLGAAPGDDSAPDIGSRRIADVRPEERTTPAGRFVAERGFNARGEDVVWVDYASAVSMHRVVTSDPEENRLGRLASPTTDDNRISYGCINVPVEFFENVIRPVFATRRASIYVLPEIKSLDDVFGAIDPPVAADPAAPAGAVADSSGALE